MKKKHNEKQVQSQSAAEEVAWGERRSGVFMLTSPDEMVPVTIRSNIARVGSEHAMVKARDYKVLFDLGLVLQGHIPPKPVSTNELRSMALDAQAIWLLAETRNELGIECAKALVNDDRISHNRAQSILCRLWIEERGKPVMERRLHP